ncbi:MAG: hypothetical protein BGO78_11775 [Chloroflexi bacterium 44-23]|nr:MAG: hypothetical protein BGO78_11775 [Chloroflexi bacterium 44-23]
MNGNLMQQLLVGLGANPWIYILLALLVMIEGPISILIAATAASSGFLNPLSVFAAASIGNLLGDTLWYLLGRSGKFEWALKLKFLKLDLARIDFLRQSISEHAVKILLIAKLTNGMIVPTLIATGLARVPMRRWFPFIFVANIFTTGAFVALGFYVAVNINRFDHWLRFVVMGASLVFIILIGYWVQRSFSRRFTVEKLLMEESKTTSG